MFTCECQVDWQLNISVAKLLAPLLGPHMRSCHSYRSVGPRRPPTSGYLGSSSFETRAEPRSMYPPVVEVAYLVSADNVSRLPPSRLREVDQPVIRTLNWFSSPRPRLLACL